MKYLKDKNTRRRGVAMEMAIMVLLVLTLLSTITVSAATILINKQSSTQKEFTEKYDRYKYDYLGEIFFNSIKIEVEKERTQSDPKIEESVNSLINAGIAGHSDLVNKFSASVSYDEIEKIYQLEVKEIDGPIVLTVKILVETDTSVDPVKNIYTIKSWEYQ